MDDQRRNDSSHSARLHRTGSAGRADSAGLTCVFLGASTPTLTRPPSMAMMLTTMSLPIAICCNSSLSKTITVSSKGGGDGWIYCCKGGRRNKSGDLLKGLYAHALRKREFLLRTAALLFLLIPAALYGQECDNRALALAVLDARTLPIETRPYIRYVHVPDRFTWDRDQEKEAIQNLSHAANLISLNSVMCKPVSLQGGDKEHRTVVCRIDLRNLVSKDSQVRDKIKFWEEFRFDPVFNRLLTKDTLDFLEAQQYTPRSDEGWFTIRATDINPSTGKQYGTYTDEKGRVHNEYMVLKKAVVAPDTPVVRVVAPHLDKALLAELIDYTQTQAPIVSLPYFLSRSMRSIQDKDAGKDTVYSLIYGGLYYELSGTPANEAALLTLLGVGDVEKGVSAEDFFRKLLSDPRRRTALLGSRVTGKDRQRLVEFLPISTVRVGDGFSLFIATRDQKRASIDIRKTLTANLLDFKEDGSEVMYVRPNGLPGYAIENAQRKFVELVPENIVKDMTIEAPISCIGCHGPEYGWMNIPPDHVARILKSKKFNIFDDLANKISREEALRQLTSLYAGDNLEGGTGVLPTVRNGHAQAIMRATGPWKASKSPIAQVDIVKVASKSLLDLFNEHVYGTVDANLALAELGHMGGGKDAPKKLRAMLPPSPSARLALLGYLGYFAIITQEDERIIRLLEGEVLSRAHWDLVRSFVAARIMEAKRRSK